MPLKQFFTRANSSRGLGPSSDAKKRLGKGSGIGDSGLLSGPGRGTFCNSYLPVKQQPARGAKQPASWPGSID